MAPRLRPLLSVLIAGITALSSGCIIPVPLDASPGSNTRPVIIKKSLSPPITQTINHTRADRFEFQIVAEDIDIDDRLYAVLERPVPNSTELIGVIKIELTPAGIVDQPNLRTGTFGPDRFCDTLPIVDTGFVAVLVSDRDFNDPIGDVITVGLTDEALWVLTCQ